VAPWLVQHAPWARHGGGGLTHVLDPSMATASQSDIRESAETVIRDTLRGRIVKGPVAWPPRREAVLRVLAPRTEGGVVPLAISPARETELLRSAFASRWYYVRTPDGRVDRSRPKKPNSPFADVGDAGGGEGDRAGWANVRAGDRLGRSMTNCRRRLRALVVELHRKSRAERVMGVEPRLATCLAPHGRVEGAIEDGPGPISGWGDQNPKGQPQAHSRSARVALMLANPLYLCETVRDHAPSRQRRQDQKHVAMRHFRNQSWRRPPPLPRLAHLSE